MRRRGWAGPVAIAVVCLAGCGPSYHKVNGVVTLDGQPVEGATVTFVSEDGSKTYSGLTDASGAFSLVSGEKQGAPAGSYKVVVVKSPVVKGGEALEPGGDDYMKHMQEEGKEAMKMGGPKTPMMMKPGMKMAPPKKPKMKTDLPEVYASATSTPITVKVPPEAAPVAIELKGESKGKS
jgi:hypothetical protein